MGQQNEKGAEEARERLYAGLTPEEREEAEQNLEAYVELVLRVWDRLENDPEAYEAMCREMEKMKEDKKFDSPRGDAQN